MGPERTDLTVCLVDGVGRPRLHTIAETLVMPNVIPIVHPLSPKGSQVFVHFDREREERDPDGRVVYRQRVIGKPDARWAYLKLSPIRELPAPKLRVEETKPRPQCNDE